MQSCQDDEELFVDKRSEIPTTGAREEFTLDSVFLYAKETYLWNTSLPEYSKFNPRKYTTFSTELENLQQELFDISQFEINPVTSRPYEFISYTGNSAKYSYIIESDDLSAGSRGSSSAFLESETYHDFGFGLAAVAATDIRLRFVNLNSPAAVSGLLRGDKVLEVNGRTVRADSQKEVDYINNAMQEPQISLTVEKSNGLKSQITLEVKTYPINPVMKKNIFTRGSKKIGYLVFDSFTRLSNSENELDAAFAEFASAGVTDLVIDFRYNGGGYVRTAEYLLNLIAPSRLHGSVMYKELYNEMMREGKAEILKNQPLLDENDQQQQINGRNATYADLDFSEEGNTYNFRKVGSLENIENVCFIVGEGTASASELVMNSLKPYLNVTIVGQQTYGKPVGFFGIKIDKYKVYVPNFKTINSQGEGEYFDGFKPDIHADDDVRYDFGDPKEESLATALEYIETGSMVPNGRMSTRSEGLRTSTGELLKIGNDHSYKGMVEDRMHLPK